MKTTLREQRLDLFTSFETLFRLNPTRCKTRDPSDRDRRLLLGEEISPAPAMVAPDR